MPPATAAMSDQEFVLQRRPSRDAAGPPRDGGRFSREDVLAAIRRWAELYGEAPITTDWEPSRARGRGEEWRVARFESGDWPALRVVRQHYGRFNAAIEAAGLTPKRAPKRVRNQLRGPDQVLAAIREWTRRYGEVPTQADWDPFRARKLRQPWRVVRYESADWPSMRTAAAHFGSLGDAIRAAGLLPREAGESQAATAARRADNRERLTGALGRQPGSSGKAVVAAAVRAVARADAEQDPERLHQALIDLAAAGLRWAGALEQPAGP